MLELIKYSIWPAIDELMDLIREGAKLDKEVKDAISESRMKNREKTDK